MFIGLGAGDIYTGITLLRASLQALSNSKGSQKEYIDAAYQLETLEVCLKVAQCKLLDLESGDSRDVLARAITECAKCIDGFQSEISKYESYFREGEQDHGSFRRKCLKELRKIQWLYEKEKTEALSKAIASHVQIITLACSIGSLPPRNEATSSSTSPQQTILSEELNKVLYPSNHIPAFAPRNRRWDLETQLDTSSITSTMTLEKDRKRNVADDQQRVLLLNSSETTLNRRVVVLRPQSTSSTSSLNANVSTSEANSPPTEPKVEEALGDDDDDDVGTPLAPAPARTADDDDGLSSVTYTLDPISSSERPTLSRTTTATTATATISNASPSIFSRRPSDTTSISIPLTSISSASTNPSCFSASEFRVVGASSSSASTLTSNTAMGAMSWVDDHGVCHNPSCQQRSFLQKKAFTVYARLMHTHGGVTTTTTTTTTPATNASRQRSRRKEPAAAAAEPTQLLKPKPTCEHSLLFYQMGAHGIK